MRLIHPSTGANASKQALAATQAETASACDRYDDGRKHLALVSDRKPEGFASNGFERDQTTRPSIGVHTYGAPHEDRQVGVLDLKCNTVCGDDPAGLTGRAGQVQGRG